MKGRQKRLDDRSARVNDAQALGLIFDRYATLIYNFCFRRTGDWAIAEDLTSIVFLEAWRRRDVVRIDDEKVKPWLFGIALNVVRNQRRSLHRYRQALSRIPPPEPERDFGDEILERLADVQQVQALRKALRRLPKREKDVIALCGWLGMSTSEAADALGVSEATVRTHLFRARERLKKRDRLIGPPLPAPSPNREGMS